MLGQYREYNGETNDSDISMDWFAWEHLHRKPAAVYQNNIGQNFLQPLPTNFGTCFDDVLTLW